jgi:5-methyltetrahydropteroyltriglutamate--homocysteine methyltransferase
VSGIHIDTTHGGSLPRPDDVTKLVNGLGEADVPDNQRQARIAGAVSDVVKHQIEVGVDFVSDGEMSKPGFVNYISDRLTGFGGESPFPPMGDLADFPEYAAELHERRGARMALPACVGPIEYRGQDAVKRDIANLRAALEGQEVKGAFIPSAAPGTIVQDFANKHYPSQDEYLRAVAGAMAQEYRAITNAGFRLQVDAPDLAMSRHIHYRDAPLEDFLGAMRDHVDALNEALSGIPPEQVRVHVCWGNYPGPHHLDVPLRDIIDVIFTVQAGAIYIEAANPRHEHEWTVFESTNLPDDKSLIVGCVDSISTHVEHPELVAQRIRRYTDLVGPDRVIAATDCGFGTFAGVGTVHRTVVWAKLKSLVEGAELASRSLSSGVAA